MKYALLHAGKGGAGWPPAFQVVFMPFSLLLLGGLGRAAPTPPPGLAGSLKAARVR